MMPPRATLMYDPRQVQYTTTGSVESIVKDVSRIADILSFSTSSHDGIENQVVLEFESHRNALLVVNHYNRRLPSPRGVRHQQGPVDAHNLYVANISPSCDNQSLYQLFSPYGFVSHVCILQTVDQTGQRRAFVDYTSASSARIAIKALDNYVIDGFRTHVDYAIVQRSGGYRPITHNRTPARPIPYSRPSQFVISSPIMDVPSLPPSDPNAATLIVDHLPDISFNSHQLTSLFLPYGRVLYSQISTDTRTDEVVGVIILGNEMQAERARIQCDGVWIMNRPIRVRSWKSIENEPSISTPEQGHTRAPSLTFCASTNSSSQYTSSRDAMSSAQHILVGPRHAASSSNTSEDSLPRTPVDSVSSHPLVSKSFDLASLATAFTSFNPFNA